MGNYKRSAIGTQPRDRKVQRDAHEKSNAGERVRSRERGSQQATMMTVVKHPTEIRWDKKRGRRRCNQLPLMKSR
ncbi:hypothetical protein Hdeb2414_s0018g00523671 [Helianthus debilis subsp. tardiflorus]